MSQLTHVTLSGGTGYRDHPAIPRRLTTEFDMWTWDPGEAGGEVRHGHVAEEGADDVVSETIRSHGVWEPPETILILDHLNRSRGGLFVDVGCQLGWFSLLAGAHGWDVLAIDGNANALGLLSESWMSNRYESSLRVRQEMVAGGFEPDAVSPLPDRIGILKVDVEGNERHVAAAFDQWIGTRSIDRILMEISPVFNKSYPEILWDLKLAGYQVWVIPDKQHPALNADDTDDWLRTHGTALHGMTKRLLTEWTNAQHQFNVWCIAS